MHTLRHALIALLLTGLATATTAATAAEARVYRCDDDGKVTYSDFPCAGAREITVNAGNAAPDARERLKRDQEALDARAAQRRDVLAREEAMERMDALRARERAEAAAATAPPADYTYPAYGIWPAEIERTRVKRNDRERRRAQRRRSVVTVPPPQHVARH